MLLYNVKLTSEQAVVILSVLSAWAKMHPADSQAEDILRVKNVVEDQVFSAYAAVVDSAFPRER